MQNPYEQRTARCLPAYWGKWFVPVKDSTMKYTDLNIFYQLGAALSYMMQNVKIGCPAIELYMQTVLPIHWLEAFRVETTELGDTFRDTNLAVLNYLMTINGIRRDIEKNFDRTMTQDERLMLSHEKEEFEKCFEREHHNLDVFTVTPKGLYSTRLLIEKPENQFPERLRATIPKQALYDIEQAGRCLAFDVPTACAYHACRATETLMLAYFEKLAGHPWHLPKNRDWHQYVTHLGLKGAPVKLTDRLMEIKNNERNPLIHPDENVGLDEALVLYDLCKGVNFYMAEALAK